jgi:hypothetical protein
METTFVNLGALIGICSVQIISKNLRVKMADIDEVDGVSDEEVEAMTAGEVLQKLEEVFYTGAVLWLWVLCQ